MKKKAELAKMEIKCKCGWTHSGKRVDCAKAVMLHALAEHINGATKKEMFKFLQENTEGMVWTP